MRPKSCRASVRCWARASVLGAPLVYRNQSLGILSGVLPEEELKRRLADMDAAAIMKLGTNFEKVRKVVMELGLGDRALYVERATMGNQTYPVPLAEVDPVLARPISRSCTGARQEVAFPDDRGPAAILILGANALATAREDQGGFAGRR